MNNYGSSNGGTELALRGEFASQGDQQLRTCINTLKASGKRLRNLDRHTRKALDLPANHARSLVGKVLGFLVPKVWQTHLPKPVFKYIAEEHNALELIERLYREYVNEVQGALRDLSVNGSAKLQELDNLRATITQAREECWDAKALQHYVAESIGIQLYPEVEQLLDTEFSMLTPQDQEVRRVELLEILERTLDLGGVVVDVNSTACSAGLQVLNQGQGQFMQFLVVYRPVVVLRDAALAMTSMNEAAFGARDALQENLQASFLAIDNALEAAQMLRKYSIGSDEMKQLMRSGAAKIEEKIREFRGGVQGNTEPEIRALPAPTMSRFIPIVPLVRFDKP